ncbi:hypothetical protein BaRGS_00010201 [Batillaria attramentaria]|uniref:Uncharacterized protein n=1 Tax=Batillaria attramentaria TaxID=370345 RepID=A0ABD0LH68_9CAEN
MSFLDVTEEAGPTQWRTQTAVPTSRQLRGVSRHHKRWLISPVYTAAAVGTQCLRRMSTHVEEATTNQIRQDDTFFTFDYYPCAHDFVFFTYK